VIIAIVGSREGLDWKLVSEEIRALVARSDVGTVVSGGALGVDRLGESLALAAGKRVHSIRPDWKKHGRGAGFIRNRAIVEMADEVHAWWNGTSRGTANSIDIARKMRKPLFLHNPSDRGSAP
jgi:hypothetical protein